MSTGNELAAGRSVWLGLHDEILRGITHALSNRVASIGAAAYMLEHGDVSTDEAARSLYSESERLDVLLQLLRLLPIRGDAEYEPVIARDIVDQAIELRSYLTDMRDVGISVVESGEIPPMWVEPHTLLRVVLLAIVHCSRSIVGDDLYACTLELSGDSDSVHFFVYPELETGDTSFLDVSGLVAAELGAQGVIESHGSGCRVSIPTLMRARSEGR